MEAADRETGAESGRQTERGGEREHCVRGLERTGRKAKLKVGILHLQLSLQSFLFSLQLHLLPLSFIFSSPVSTHFLTIT